jgi:hypothetical protein
MRGYEAVAAMRNQKAKVRMNSWSACRFLQMDYWGHIVDENDNCVEIKTGTLTSGLWEFYDVEFDFARAVELHDAGQDVRSKLWHDHVYWPCSNDDFVSYDPNECNTWPIDTEDYKSKWVIHEKREK